jgi:hypothetical protein
VDLNQIERVRIGLPEPLLAFVSDDIEVKGPSEAAASAAFAVAGFCEEAHTSVDFYRKAKIDVARWRNVVSVVPNHELSDQYPDRWGAEVHVVDRHGIEHSIIQNDIVVDDVASMIEEKFILNVGTSETVVREWLVQARGLDAWTDISAFREHTLMIGRS